MTISLNNVHALQKINLGEQSLKVPAKQMPVISIRTAQPLSPETLKYCAEFKKKMIQSINLNTTTTDEKAKEFQKIITNVKRQSPSKYKASLSSINE